MIGLNWSEPSLGFVCWRIGSSLVTKLPLSDLLEADEWISRADEVGDLHD